ncbi:pentatricopeptide repeat-containing protein 2, mitochondrial-like [Plodia interpunctella]|uniref:pentatricopeptide repeat-containing protein 2, mitochondrial-like n=1 Tax=Plodia interpunctella TaxID=58824 RepID=UPI00236744B6|nr:pentatricopeptide repeat-containing protein 2, mitochondrial-like [Plodia interpunctella]
MSIFVKNFVKISLNNNLRLFSPCRSHGPCRAIHFTKVQHLYSPLSLGIDNYLQTRKRVKDQFVSFSDKFRTKMIEFVGDSKNMIFTEDLKNMVHIAEPTDLDLIVKMIKKFNTQSTEYRFGSFVFGPVVMRMFHFLDAPKEALQCFYDPANNEFFDQLVSYQLLLDLLYNHEMYDEMYKVFEVIKEKQINMTKYPKYSVVLILAACYKQNTKQSLEYASSLWSDMTSVGTTPVRRASSFFAALALKQGAPHIALEAISTQKQNYVTIRNIKATALARGARADDALRALRAVLELDAPAGTRHTFFEETISAVRQAVEQSNDKDLQREFETIEKALNDRGLIDNQTLDQLVSSEITVNVKNKTSRGVTTFQNKKLPFDHRQRRNMN